MNKRIYYVTTVNVSDLSAQSLQIKSMGRAFYNILNLNFKLYAFGSSVKDSTISFPCKILTERKSKLIRTIYVFLSVIRSKNFGYSIFTRDLYLALLFVLIGKKVVWEAHQETSLIAKKILRFLNVFSSFKVLTISDALKHSDQIPIDKHKISSYHDGVSLNDPFIEGDIITFSNQNTALYTGALHKGLDIESLEPLFAVYKDWDFLFVGGKNLDIKHYESMFKNYENVTFLGRLPHSEIIKYQKSASVLLYPLTVSNTLWRYTSPLKLFEYMSSGKPIVGSNIGSVAEIINDGNAFVFQGENGVVEAFQRYLLAPDELILEHKTVNGTLIKNKFNWDKRVEFIVFEMFH
jgi:glycosyltransferase involved in cell wall biosynthesis